MDQLQRCSVGISVLVFVGLSVACGERASRNEPSSDGAGGAGQSAIEPGGTGGSIRPVGGSFGTAMPFGGSAAVGGSSAVGGGFAVGGSSTIEPTGGTTAAGGTSPVGGFAGQPLSNTRLCDNDFIRVDVLPELALGFEGTFDGQSVKGRQTESMAGPPVFHVFRFGPTHIENVSFDFYLEDGPYRGSLSMAYNCSMYGTLFRETETLEVFKFETATLHTTTFSADGFTGLTAGKIQAEWRSESGERRVLVAEITLPAVMGDARTEL